MKTIKLSGILLAFTLMLGTSCKKYEEGPFISLRSKKERLSNEWKIDKMYDENGNELEISELERALKIIYEKSGGFSIKLGDDDFITGTWEFGDKKKTIISTHENPFTSEMEKDTVQIIKLKEKELWLENSDGGRNQFIPFD